MLADLLALADGFVRDESNRLTPSDKESALALALTRYGIDRPLSLVADVTSGGGDTLPLPEGWVAGVSEATGAEYPIGQTPPSPLACTLYTAPAGAVLRLGASLAAGADVRLTFTVPHVVSDTEDTVQAIHREAVAAYAASILLEELAAASINDSDSTLQADATNRRNKAAEYRKQAETLRDAYATAMGRAASAGGGGQAASGTTVSWPSRSRLRARRTNP